MSWVFIIVDLNIDLDPFRHEELNILVISLTLPVDLQNLLSELFLKEVRVLLLGLLDIDADKRNDEKGADYDDWQLAERAGAHEVLDCPREDHNEERNDEDEDHEEGRVVGLQHGH